MNKGSDQAANRARPKYLCLQKKIKPIFIREQCNIKHNVANKIVKDKMLKRIKKK